MSLFSRAPDAEQTEEAERNGAFNERQRIRALIQERITDHNREARKTPIESFGVVLRAKVQELTSLLDEIGT